MRWLILDSVLIKQSSFHGNEKSSIDFQTTILPVDEELEDNMVEESQLRLLFKVLLVCALVLLFNLIAW